MKAVTSTGLFLERSCGIDSGRTSSCRVFVRSNLAILDDGTGRPRRSTGWARRRQTEDGRCVESPRRAFAHVEAGPPQWLFLAALAAMERDAR